MRAVWSLRSCLSTRVGRPGFNLYKKYTDVRIVFAPEAQAAFFGGDPDNFTYPRYDLDMAIFRVYENGKPIHTDNFLKWNSAGAAEHELTFVSGHPGSTERDETYDQILLDATVINPLTLGILNSRTEVLKQYAARGPEQARQVSSDIFGLENARKVYDGRVVALGDKAVLAKKQAEEADFKAKVAANPALQKQYGGAWEQVAAIDKLQSELRTPEHLPVYRGHSLRPLRGAWSATQPKPKSPTRIA